MQARTLRRIANRNETEKLYSMRNSTRNHLMKAVMAGLLLGNAAQAQVAQHQGDRGASYVASSDQGEEKPVKELHACKGLNSCKGKGGCSASQNGCKGLNSCKGKGGCATAKHDCKGKNACKAQGGCKSGDNGCAAKNSCKGKGGCASPVKAGH